MAIAKCDFQRGSAEVPQVTISREPAIRRAPGPAELRRLTPRTDLPTSRSLVHCLLFLVEYTDSPDTRRHDLKYHLGLFLSRAGGLHLLLMLLNAYYNKPMAGRRPGWAFRGMRKRIDISERALRMLINDAMAAGLIVQQRGDKDRRCRSYALTPAVVAAWEGLTETLRKSLTDVFDQFDAGALANVDYRKWDPAIPARDQIERLSPSRRPASDNPASRSSL